MVTYSAVNEMAFNVLKEKGYIIIKYLKKNGTKLWFSKFYCYSNFYMVTFFFFPTIYPVFHYVY